MSLSQARTRLIGRLGARKTRTREGRVLVEGVRAVREALAAGAAPVFAVVSSRLGGLAGGEALGADLAGSGVDVVALEDRELSELSRTEQHQGVLLVVAEPKHDAVAVARGPRCLVLDGVQDPGNVGTLVRAAHAFGVDGVLILEGSADPWGPKSVRASAGSVFRLPVTTASSSRVGSLFAEAGVPLLVADGSGPSVREWAERERFALVVGNEGAGVSDAVRSAATDSVSVPMPGGAESLNVGMAGAVLLYELTQESAV